ncbi:MAG: VCBS repeat-containing protein [Ferruginibacter sp.]
MPYLTSRSPVFKYSCAVFFVSALFFLASCNDQATLFNKLPAAKTGIHFNNVVIENDSINPIDMEFLYNGGGVAVGDFNSDGLPDLYFTASTVSNKLYLNKGNLSFDDITTTAGVDGAGSWCNAASVVDINGDGLEDIYVCTSIKNVGQRKNLLYINEGKNKDGIPVFKERSQEYGLADTGFSVHAAFFDYDNDGDLDMYLVETKLAKRQAASFGGNNIAADRSDVDKLFRNDYNDSLRHPVFTDVSKEAGITDIGFGLGISIADINKDGWKDIYITNDFFGSDLLYINNKNGTFTNQVKSYFKHTSQNAMGNDIADINNDGLADVIAVDMNPEDNFRKKKNMASNNYYVYQSMMYENLMLQYVRNTLQLNMGPSVGANDSVAHPVFGDISFYAGVAETDWSWTPSIADVDNDGNRDIIITNGYPKDVTDHDFAAFRSKAQNLASKETIIEQIPQIKVANYAFKNNGDLKFVNMAKEWGLGDPSFSTGAIYADLDNDGDVDYVVNNINEDAFVYENKARQIDKDSSNFLSVKFKGDNKNAFGLGAWAEIYYANGKQQVYENSPYRGYLSTVDTKAYFGLGNTASIDSVIIRWPGNKKQKMLNVKVNQLLVADIKNADLQDGWGQDPIASKALFADITNIAGINYVHHEYDYIDFNIERLLPHKLSQYGPGLAAGDVDGNGLDDILIGGSGDYPGKFFMQQAGGKFTIKPLPNITAPDARRPENEGLLLFDADNDGDLDLYCASGSNEFAANTKNYQDLFLINDGKGNYSFDTTAFPKNYVSKSCVKAADYDNDGDLDLFIGGRCLPGKYPQPVSSFIYRNDSKGGVIKFTDVTAEVAKGLQNIGLVCDALWSDYDNDGFVDLVLAGEWMPVTFLKNDHGKFQNVAQSGINNEVGWWSSIAAGDFDNDGDIDYIAGNLGENSFYRASNEYPVSVYGKDFDKNKSFDAITTLYLKDTEGKRKEYTAQNRDDIVEQLPPLKRKFLTYKDFANADIHGLFSEEELKDALHLKANNFKTSFIKNVGGGKFQLVPLPALAQLAPVYGMVADDFNNDGNLDILLSGNDFGTEVTNGRYDAMNSLLLTGDGKGAFATQTILQSGILIPGDAKALIKLKSDNGYLLASSENRGPLKIFSKKDNTQKLVALEAGDKAALITLNNGLVRKEEMYYGNSFQSQSSRFIAINSNITKVEAINSKGVKRVIFSK